MTNNKMTNNKNNTMKRYVLALAVAALFMILAKQVAAPPSPHTIEGRILTNSTNGVQNEIPVLINNTISGDILLTYTFAPDIPELRGGYSASINGDDGDIILVTAWNATHYGTNTSILLSSTTNIN